MPRPSDVYATLGAPGVYQARSWTPRRLPNVYVFPPEEDKTDAFCLFHSGSVSPTSFESFYSNPVYSQGGVSNPAFTDVTTLDHALTYIPSRNGSGGSSYDRSSGLEDEKPIVKPPRNYSSSASSVSSHSSSLDSVREPPMVRPGISKRGLNQIPDSMAHSNTTLWVEEPEEPRQQTAITAPSRRSSVFGDRPPDHEILAQEENQSRSKSKTLRSMALNVLGSSKVKQIDNHNILPESGGQRDIGAETILLEQDRSQKKRSRRTFAKFFGSNAIVDIRPSAEAGNPAPAVLPVHLLPSTNGQRLNKRKSVARLFGLTRSSAESVTRTDETHLPMRPDPDQLGISSEALSIEQKLSRRKSMAQFLGLRRSTPPTATGDTAIASSQSMRSGSPVSITASSGTAVPSGKRASFLSTHSFSFLDLHRRFASDTVPAALLQEQPAHDVDRVTPPTSLDSPDSLSEKTDSSSVLATPEDCGHVSEPRIDVRIPAIVPQAGAPFVADIAPKLMPGGHLNENFDFSTHFGLHAEDGETENGVDDDPPTLELVARLDSLSFDQLVFDPESFADSYL